MGQLQLPKIWTSWQQGDVTWEILKHSKTSLSCSWFLKIIKHIFGIHAVYRRFSEKSTPYKPHGWTSQSHPKAPHLHWPAAHTSTQAPCHLSTRALCPAAAAAAALVAHRRRGEHSSAGCFGSLAAKSKRTTGRNDAVCSLFTGNVLSSSKFPSIVAS